MDKQRDKFLNEILTIEKSINKTNSIYLKRDYIKALKKMKRELQEYDIYKGYVKKLKP